MKFAWLLIALSPLGIIAVAGCQVYEGGTGILSEYDDEDFQFHPTGTEFKLTREDTQKEYDRIIIKRRAKNTAIATESE